MKSAMPSGAAAVEKMHEGQKKPGIMPVATLASYRPMPGRNMKTRK